MPFGPSTDLSLVFLPFFTLALTHHFIPTLQKLSDSATILITGFVPEQIMLMMNPNCGPAPVFRQMAKPVW